MLNRQELHIYNTIQAYTATKGYPPSVREIGNMVGLKSSCSVHSYMHRLKRAGLIDFEPCQPRTLRVIPHD